MKVFGVSFIFAAALVTVLSCVSYIAPFYFYKKLIHQKLDTDWFFLEGKKQNLLLPNEFIDFHSPAKKVNEDLWKKFHIRDLIVPLPYRNPFYYVVPALSFNDDESGTQVGLKITTPQGSLLNQIYFFPNSRFPNYMARQKIFELPYFKQVIKKKEPVEIFHDVFTKDISPWKIDFDEMMYNLYLLQFRNEFLGQKILSYGAIRGSEKYYFELEYWDLDYSAYMVFHLRGKDIYSFLIISRKSDNDASKIRENLVYNIDYLQSSSAITNILLKEFRALSYRNQINQPGMLFLFSAWTHQMNNRDILDYIVKIQERGSNNQPVLKNMYEYSYSRYGDVYSTRNITNLGLGGEVELQRKMKLEKINENFQPEMKKSQQKSIEEEYNEIIKNTVPKSQKFHKKLQID